MIDLFIKRFLYYKELGDKTLVQLTEEQMFWQFNDESNSVAIIVKHVAGNMFSRWTNFLTEDGEKDWRNRDSEFENSFSTKEEVVAFWEQGWACFLEALNQINDENLNATIYIRKEPHSVLDAVLRQLAHYPYHIGQIIYIAKMVKNDDWKSLSIPRNKSNDFNKEMDAKFGLDLPQNSSPVCSQNSGEVRDEFKA